MGRQIRLPYQEPPSALEQRVHDLELRVTLLAETVALLAEGRRADGAAQRPLIAGGDGRDPS